MKKKWSEDSVRKEANKFHSIQEWRERGKGSYLAASRLGIFKDISKNMKANCRPKWTAESILKDAKRYSSKIEWKKHSQSAIVAAKKMGIFEQAVSHMSRPKPFNFKWDFESVLYEAKKFSSISEWQAESKGSYHSAWLNGWIDQAIVFFDKKSGSSKPEVDLLSYVKSRYPKANKVNFCLKKDELEIFSPAKRFQLDIYIPELRKGIEFNGDYWHSFNGLKRGRPNWSDEDIAKYHHIKKAFFSKRKIDYIDIKEADWKKDKESVLSSIDLFLGQAYGNY